MRYTPVQNRFWSDGWVRGLNALDRYLFLYLLTNGRAQCTGIYELPIDIMATECGIDEKDLRLSMLIRLEPKVYYKEGWVIIMNFIKHRISNSPALVKGIHNEFEELPSHIKEIALQKGYPLHTLPRPSRSRVEESRVDTYARNAQNEIKEVPLNSDSREKPQRKTTSDMISVFSLFSWNPARSSWKLRVVERDAAQTLFDTYGLPELERRLKIVRKYKDEQMCPRIDSPSEFLTKMTKMEHFLKSL